MLGLSYFLPNSILFYLTCSERAEKAQSLALGPDSRLVLHLLERATSNCRVEAEEALINDEIDDWLIP